LRRKFSDKKLFINKILNGELRPASKLLSLIERRDPSAIPYLTLLYPYTGKTRLIGITGPAGAGKSTLMSQLISAFRQKNKSIGVLAIDPASPFTGGAILGDRIRMQAHFLDKEVFIRSMATRNVWGGISPALFDAIHVLDAMGKEIVFVETVGVGQNEVQIAGLAETVVLVLSPGFGDSVQILKAGLLEIGDIIVVNKGDLKGSGHLVQELKEMDSSRTTIRVSAMKGEGLSSLVSLLEREGPGGGMPRTDKVSFVVEEMKSLLRENVFNEETSVPFTEKEIEAVYKRKRSPYTLVRSWMNKHGSKG